MFHVPRQRKSWSLALPRHEKTHTHARTHARAPFLYAHSSLPRCRRAGRALGSLARCSRGGCVSRGSMRDQWLALTNSQRTPLISRLRDQNLREREEKWGKKLRRRADLHVYARVRTPLRKSPCARQRIIFSVGSSQDNIDL